MENNISTLLKTASRLLRSLFRAQKTPDRLSLVFFVVRETGEEIKTVDELFLLNEVNKARSRQRLSKTKATGDDYAT